jgi:hypothetical protein
MATGELDGNHTDADDGYREVDSTAVAAGAVAIQVEDHAHEQPPDEEEDTVRTPTSATALIRRRPMGPSVISREQEWMGVEEFVKSHPVLLEYLARLSEEKSDKATDVVVTAVGVAVGEMPAAKLDVVLGRTRV